MAGNQSVILFRTHFLLNLLKNANFPARLPIFVHILTCVLHARSCVLRATRLCTHIQLR